MPRTRQIVAQGLAERLFAVEDAIDAALTRVAELSAAMPQARAEARLPAMIGQDALAGAAETFAALVEARRRIVETHASLDTARTQIGLKEIAGGDLIPKPAPFDTEGRETPTPLRAVA